jgi:hypothetical protein
MLGAAQLDRDARIGAEEIDLQLALGVEWNRERDIETESAVGFGECLKPPEEKCFRRAPGSIHTGLGLKLEPQQAPLEVVVVDRADRPTPDGRPRARVAGDLGCVFERA